MLSYFFIRDIKSSTMKREADEDTQPTPYPNNKRRLPVRNKVSPENEANVEDGTTDEELPPFLAELPLAVLQKLGEKVSTTEGARDFIDKFMPKLLERLNLPHEELLQKVEMFKDLHFPEDVSLPMSILS